MEIANASAATEVTVDFEFHEGFVLKLVEHDTSIIQFNEFSVIECIGKSTCIFLQMVDNGKLNSIHSTGKKSGFWLFG